MARGERDGNSEILTSRTPQANLVADQRKTLRMREAKKMASQQNYGTASSNARNVPTSSSSSSSQSQELPVLSPETISNLKLLVGNVELNVKEVGVYRVPGDSTEVKELVVKVTSGVVLSNESLSNLSSVNVTTSAIKMVLRSHQPAIPYPSYGAFVQASSPLDAKAALASLHDASFLRYFLKHIALVAKNEKDNKMGNSQLATCCGVVLFRESEKPPTDLIAEGEKIKRKVEVFKMILDNLDEVLDDGLEAGADSNHDNGNNDAKPAALPKVESDLVEEFVEDVDDGWGDEEDVGEGDKKNNDQVDGIVEDDLEMADVTNMSILGGTAGGTTAGEEKEVVGQEQVEGAEAGAGVGGDEGGEGDVETVAAGQEAATGKEGERRASPVEDLVIDTSVANLSAKPQSTTPAVTTPTPDQCTIKVTWKKNSADEPSSKEAIIAVFSEFGNVKKVGIKETSDAKKSKSALVVFETPESVKTAISGYKGSWKVKAYVISGDGLTAGGNGGEQPGSTKSATSTASTPKSTKSNSSAKNSKVVDSMFERSIKVSWINSVRNQPPTSNELKKVFAKYGTVSKLMPTDKEPYAVILFQNAEEALSAAANYEGELKSR